MDRVTLVGMSRKEKPNLAGSVAAVSELCEQRSALPSLLTVSVHE